MKPGDRVRRLLHLGLSPIRGHRLAGWALADQIMVSGVNFLTGILIARFLGVREFGLFSLAWMAVLFAGSLQHALISAPMMSIGPKQGEYDPRAYRGAVLIQQVVFCVASFALLYAGVRVFELFFVDRPVEGQGRSLALALASAAVAVQMQDFLRRLFFSRERAATAFVNDAVAYLGRLALLIHAFRVSTPTGEGVLWMIAGASIAATGLGLCGLGRVAWRRDVLVAVTGRHWRSSRWLLPSVLLQWASGNLLIMGAGAILGVAAVGALKAAQNVMGVTHILFQGLENIVPVWLAARLREGGERALHSYLKTIVWLCAASTAVVGLPAWLFAEFWLDLIYAGEYASYGDVLRWYVVVYLAMAVVFPLRLGLRTLEHTRPLFLAQLGAAALTCVGLYPLIHFFGLPGVMAGTLGVQVLTLVVLRAAWRKRTAG